ncbi:methyltransferase domain-containing protein [Egicoccus sp. AB-alg2]|uniref:methyltransferase domain-containing protein n=1 Tax=Egicoccus sp. AB-alg2 TaxID=3242693 RepID=UPI00359D1AD3
MDLDERTLTSVAAYDEHAAAYQQSLRLKRPVADVRRFADRTRRDALVLDAGCGPANDLRLLRDAGVHPVGVDLAMGALREARMLLPRHPLVRAPLHALPFRRRSFGGLWLSGTFTHLPRAAWRPVFADLLGLLDRGPVYLACYRGNADLERLEDPVLGEVYVSAAVETEVEALFTSHGLQEVTIEVRPDPIHDRRRPWVVALGTLNR